MLSKPCLDGRPDSIRLDSLKNNQHLNQHFALRVRGFENPSIKIQTIKHPAPPKSGKAGLHCFCRLA
jgi:hypothetical protein